MEKYGEKLPVMSAESLESDVATTAEAERILMSATMRCGGCGAKACARCFWLDRVSLSYYGA